MVLIDSISEYLYRNTEFPSLFWRSGSYSVLLGIHTLCWTALNVFNKTEVHGLDRFLDLLKSRADYKTRKKGLITVSNHISVLDDPVIWGTLPLSFAAFYAHINHRWSFASHDLCFTNGPLSHFFTLGQCLPTHRIKHSPHGGLFQPTFTEAVRLLSRIDANGTSYNPHCSTIQNYPSLTTLPTRPQPHWPLNVIDPLSSLTTTHSLPPPAYPTYPHDVRLYNAPSRYASNSHSWIHIFPEGFIHQTDPSERYMRYFKWGVSRLILEPPECPDIVPMFIEGTDQMMHESREFPRFLPRFGKNISVTFGAEVDVESVFGDLRRRWREIWREKYARVLDSDEGRRWLQTRREREHFLGTPTPADSQDPGINAENLQKTKTIALDHLYRELLGVVDESLQTHPEVVELRKECTRRVREEVLKVRRSRGYPDEDPKAGIAQTWKLEGPRREGRMEDDSWVKET